MYLLFRAIREHSTVALSGDSADELFGGYPWFHLPQAQRADTFPWRAVGPSGDDGGFGQPDLMAALDIPAYLHDSYATAVAEVDHLPGVSERERRMRTICYLHLTRFLQMLLDRKDRMSMAVGLEVRVPFCDHRLVEYVYNTPWSIKTYDGREKSLLRGAVRDLLPRPVLTRMKSQYPSTTDSRYPAALQQQAKELLVEPDHPVFAVVNRDWVVSAAAVDPAQVTHPLRYGLERALDLATWLDIHDPQLRTS
jgi:asparagine synthase (glutamine-hydrolysing)